MNTPSPITRPRLTWSADGRATAPSGGFYSVWFSGLHMDAGYSAGAFDADGEVIDDQDYLTKAEARAWCERHAAQDSGGREVG